MIGKISVFCCIWAAALGFSGSGIAFAAGETPVSEAGNASMEMPVMTGVQWQTLQPESKLAFIWGIGHVVTIEEHVVQRHPELKRPDFTEKLAEGLRGIPMNSIIQDVDRYYQANPQEVDWPVMKVIWRTIVKPKLKSGIADTPLQPPTPR